MRIAILATGSGTPVWLAGESGTMERIFSSAGDLSIDGNTIAETQTFVRAAAGKVRDRLNLITTISFSTSRIFTNPDDAELWAADYDGAFAREGALRMDMVAPGGGVTTRYLHDCTVAPPSRRVRGVTVVLNYTATGGAITSSAPS